MGTNSGFAIALLLAALCGGMAVWLAGRWGRRFFWRQRRQRGRRGENQARAVLVAAGFRVVASQPRLPCEVTVDGTKQPYHLQADYLVERDGRTYVVEVKTGKTAPDLTYAPTRRQLLEYFLHYPVGGALLVDMESGTVREIQWALRPDLTEDVKTSRRSRGFVWIAGLALVAGLLLGSWLQTAWR